MSAGSYYDQTEQADQPETYRCACCTGCAGGHLPGNCPLPVTEAGADWCVRCVERYQEQVRAVFAERPAVPHAVIDEGGRVVWLADRAGGAQ